MEPEFALDLAGVWGLWVNGLGCCRGNVRLARVQRLRNFLTIPAHILAFET